MPSRDLSLVLVRVLAALHGLAALAAVLLGTYLAGYDLLDGDTGDWDGFGILVGSVLLGAGIVPLLLATAAVVSARPGVVRCCGALLGAAALVCGLLLQAPHGVVLLPPLLLLAVAVGSWMVSDPGRPVEV